jgi:sugar lactone lactonase YvrE
MSHPSPRRLALLAATAAVALACATTGWAVGTAQDTIPLPRGWQPEGIARGPGDQLFVGSIPTGRIIRVDPRTGRRRIVVPRRDGRAALGLKVSGGRIFVAGGPTGHAFVYDARTGADVANVTLTAAPTLINDVAVGPRAAWFTDSQKPQLYRLGLGRAGAPASTAATVPLTGDLKYDADPDTFDANGIAAAQGARVLLVVQTRTGGLYRVDPATGVSTTVPLTGGDGRLVDPDGILLVGRTLYVVQNRTNRIAVVRLSNDLTRGTIQRTLTDSDLDVPTAVARARGALYAVNARFGTEPTPATEYDVVRVSLPRGAGRQAER